MNDSHNAATPSLRAGSPGALLLTLTLAGYAIYWPAMLHELGLVVGVLLIAALILPAPLDSIGPLLAIVYAGWLAWQFWRAGRS